MIPIVTPFDFILLLSFARLTEAQDLAVSLELYKRYDIDVNELSMLAKRTPPYVTELADDLHYSYLGNQLMRVTDLATQVPYAGMQTLNPIPLINKMQNRYNGNGALSFDMASDRSIEYNFLNLPSEVQIPIGPEQSFVYDAAGKKVAEYSYVKSIRRTYADNVIYQDGQPVYIGLEEGYYANGAYFATISDYQGSIVMVLKTTSSTKSSNEVVECNQYDPFGVELGLVSNGLGVQPFKHQGKERLEFAGTWAHDHGARMAHNAIGRWTVMDPLMEKYYPVSPYWYCGNNPVSFLDPDGMELVLTGEAAQEAIRQMQARARDKINLQMNEEGVVSYDINEDVRWNRWARKLRRIIDHRRITVNIYATNSEKTRTGRDFFGGAFMGTTLIRNENGPDRVNTYQEINPSILNSVDGDLHPCGTTVFHELTESFFAGKRSLKLKKNAEAATPKVLEDPNSIYNKAHGKATPQPFVLRSMIDINDQITTNVNEADAIIIYVIGNNDRRIIIRKTPIN